ncbi:MAG: polyphosphate:AMP phosphotransferase [Longimicrobiales bacterium]
MFEVAELGHKVTEAEYRAQEPLLRERLLVAQARLVEADFPVIVLFAGVDGAGKGDMSNHLSWWLDPRLLTTEAYDRPTTQEAERPEFWRFWRDLPAKGRLGVFLKAWYSKPLLQRAYDRIDESEFARQLDHIVSFEDTLANDGALILKVWMHLGREQQEARLRALEGDPRTAWRVRSGDWEHWSMYTKFAQAAEHLISRTSSDRAPWRIVEGTQALHRRLTTGAWILERLELALAGRSKNLGGKKGKDATAPTGGPPLGPAGAPTILETLDLTQKLTRQEYETRLIPLQAQLNILHRTARDAGRALVLVMEGYDAAGKGGAIRRLTESLDARSYRVHAVGPPTEEERGHHYLWRFWRNLPRDGHIAIFDRSWYGRVLVERIEGFAADGEWRRAYAEINEFERLLVEHGVTVIKFWLQLSPEEQAARFKSREATPYKRWKLTEEDWRNRKRRAAYEVAVHDMVARTSIPEAPWHLIEAEDKRFARIRILEETCAALRTDLGDAVDPEMLNMFRPVPSGG